MRIYVAGSWEERELARTVMKALIGEGHTITHDWTCEDAEESLQEAALKDREGVKTAHVVVALPGEAGTWFEIGYAVGRHTPVILYRPPVTDDWTFRECIFEHLGLPKARTFGDLLSML